MLDLNNWELLGLAVDVFVVYLLNRFYKNQVKEADQIAHAASYDVGVELKSVLNSTADKCLPYVCVTGLVKPISAPLKSHFTDSVGVIQHELFVEHKSKRTQGFWADVKNVIKDQLNIRPFVLVSSDDRISGSQCCVEVTDALSAEGLRDSLSVTHDHYKPTSGNLLARGLDRLFGEVTKGYQETEKMLGVNVRLLGIGTLMLVGGDRIILSPPGDGHRYFLTTSSKHELISSLKSVARSLNIARWVVGIAGLAAIAYIIRRAVKKYKSQSECRQLLAELTDRRRAAAVVATDSETTTSQCVVCLNQPREVVLLNCGHICVCGDCAAALPLPKLCPVCRQPIDRIIPTYVS